MKLLKFLPALLLSVPSVYACPDCALTSTGGQIETQTIVSKLAFSSSTLFMLGIFFAVAGFMTWTMVKTCREISRERALSSSGEA
jgi:heme/copper-type cytochrome/quinol oxidase subunit 2